MASQHSVCKFQQVSSAAAYNIINVRNQHSRLVYLDMRHDPRTPFPTAILPLRGLADNSSDLCVVLSCLRSCLSGDHAARCRIVLFIEERRLTAIEHDMATRLCGTVDANFALFAAHRMKYCCVDIDPLFQSVPPEFIGAALSAASAPRVPSLIECLLPRNVFLCEQKLVAQALNPISGLGVCCVLNVTPNPPSHRPDITRSFPIEDNADGDIESVCTQTRTLLHDVLGQQQTVLVHCAAGVSRSGCVVIDFVMHALRVDFQTAKKLVRISRPEVTPNAAFEQQLDKSPRWGLAAMQMLERCVAKLTSQAQRAVQDERRSAE